MTINTVEFVEFPKIARLNRDALILEKIDGTNAQVLIEQAPVEVPHDPFVLAVVNGLTVKAGSRNRFIDSSKSGDNMGFARWVQDHAEELATGLGTGRHFGEWWGAGIQRRYGLKEKRFSLFNVSRWHAAGETPRQIPQNDPRVIKETEPAPACVSLVPILYRGPFCTEIVKAAVEKLRVEGSAAAPGFMDPEGVVVFHLAGNVGFKVTLKNDESPKGLVK